MDLMKTLGEVEQAINDCMSQLEKTLATMSTSDIALQNFQKALSDTSELDKKRYLFLLGLKHIGEQIRNLLPTSAEKLSYIEGRIQKIFQSFKSCGVYVLPRGELENYLPEYKGNLFKISDEDKAETFEKERDFLLRSDLAEQEICQRYSEIIKILDEATASKAINLDLHLSYTIGDWINKVQFAYVRGEVKDIDSLKRNASVDWATYSRIFDLLDFSVGPDGFTCRIKLKSSLDPKEREVVFDNRNVPASYRLTEN